MEAGSKEEERTNNNNNGPEPEEELEKEASWMMMENVKLDEDKTRKKKTKLVKHRMSQALMDRLIKKKKPPVKQPYLPSYSPDWRLTEIQARHAAEREAALQVRDNIVKQYNEKGFAEVLFEVTDDDDA